MSIHSWNKLALAINRQILCQFSYLVLLATVELARITHVAHADKIHFNKLLYYCSSSNRKGWLRSCGGGSGGNDHIRSTRPCSENTPLIIKLSIHKTNSTVSGSVTLTHSFSIFGCVAYTVWLYYSHYACGCRPASLPLFHFHYIYIHLRVFRLVLAWCQRRERTNKNKAEEKKLFACQRVDDFDDEFAVFGVSVAESLESFECECVERSTYRENCSNVSCFISLFCIVVLFSRATVKFVLHRCWRCALVSAGVSACALWSWTEKSSKISPKMKMSNTNLRKSSEIPRCWQC